MSTIGTLRPQSLCSVGAGNARDDLERRDAVNRLRCRDNAARKQQDRTPAENELGTMSSASQTWTLEDLRQACRLYRSAIERCHPRYLPVTLHDFPRGACGDAALLLAKHLDQLGFGTFQYMLGERNGHSHAWLERDDLIIDITGDQFEDGPEAVFVSNKGSAWHDGFAGEAQHIADFEIFDDHTKFVFGIAVEGVRAQLRP